MSIGFMQDKCSSRIEQRACSVSLVAGSARLRSPLARGRSMVWQPELEELERRKALAYRMGGEENIERQRRGGKLTIRERLDRLVDPGSFREMGVLAGVPTYEDGDLTALRPSNYVMGTGRIDGRRVVVGGDDFTVRGGAADGAIGGKSGYAERMAREYKIPIIRLVDGTGGGGSVRTLENKIGRAHV